MAGGFLSNLFGGNRLPRPCEIPNQVGIHLITRLKKDPDWTWKQRAVLRARGEKRGCFDIRVFDDVQARSRQIAIRDYHSLDDHPEFILLEGWFDKKTGEIQIIENQGPSPETQAQMEPPPAA